MSFSGNILRNVEKAPMKIMEGIISIAVGVIILPFLEFLFARWIDPSFEMKFWVILIIFILPTFIISLRIAKPVLQIIWILLTLPLGKKDA